MDARIDLDAANRDELIALIVQQQAVIGRLERRIAQLEDNAKPGGPSGMPGLKPRSSPKSPAPQQSRKPRPHGFSRRRMAPTHRVEHAVESCLDCGTPLSRRADVRHIPMPAEAGDLRKCDSGLTPIVIEKTQLDLLGDLGEHGEIGSSAAKLCAKWKLVM